MLEFGPAQWFFIGGAIHPGFKEPLGLFYVRLSSHGVGDYSTYFIVYFIQFVGLKIAALNLTLYPLQQPVTVLIASVL